jgi:hypothetical protein
MTNPDRRIGLVALLLAACTLAAPLSAQDTTAVRAFTSRTKVLADSIAKRSTSPTIDRQAAHVKALADSITLAARIPAPPAPTPIPAPTAQTARLEIRPSTGSFPVGAPVQFTATPRAADGTLLTAAVRWSASPSSVATISGVGVLTPIAAGSVTVTARADTASKSVALTITAPIVPDSAPTTQPQPPPPPPPVGTPPVAIFAHPFGPPSNGAILATLPQDTVDASYPAITRRYPCTNLQACLDTAQTGDEVLLAPGANFRDATVKPTARALWTVVRTNISDAQLGGPWTRMTKSRADALNLATIHTSGGAASAITVNSGAHHVRFVGVRIVPDATYTNALVRVGLGETTVAQLPHHITLDRVVIDGDTNSVQRCIAFDGDYLALLSSTLANCHAKSGDSQGVLQINGRGPTRIENNAIAAGHQMVFLGGGDPSIRGIVPADIVIRRNDLSRPLAWKGVWQEKTNIELKIGKRVLIEGNAICHTWPDAQDGHAILLKTENQGGGTWGDWSETSDVTVRYNLICGAGSGFNLAPLPGGPGVPMSRVTIYGNVADSLGVGPYNSGTGEAMLNQGVADVVYRDNWNRNVGRACLYLSGVSQRFAASGNVCSGQYGIFGEGTGVAGAAPGAVITGSSRPTTIASRSCTSSRATSRCARSASRS